MNFYVSSLSQEIMPSGSLSPTAIIFDTTVYSADANVTIDSSGLINVENSGFYRISYGGNFKELGYNGTKLGAKLVTSSEIVVSSNIAQNVSLSCNGFFQKEIVVALRDDSTLRLELLKGSVDAKLVTKGSSVVLNIEKLD